MAQQRSKRTIAILLGVLLAALLLVSFLSPEFTIRRDILFRLHPISSFSADILDTGRYDAEYGYLYDVTGYVDRATGDELGVFYLKKLGPLWYVASAGTGP